MEELLSIGVGMLGGYYLLSNQKIDNKQALYVAIFLIIVYFFFIKESFEGNTNVQLTDTIVADEDAFTGLDCASDTLPIYRFKRNPNQTSTIRCLINPQTNACYNKNELFGANENPSCNEFSKNLRNRLVNPTSTTRKIFEASNPYSVHECSVKGLQTPGHWCNDVYSEINKINCSVEPTHRNCNNLKSLNAFLETQDNVNEPVTPYNFKLSGASCNTKCVRQSGAIPPNPATYDCMIKSMSRGRVTGTKPDPDCAGTKRQMQQPFDIYQQKYGTCLSECVSNS